MNYSSTSFCFQFCFYTVCYVEISKTVRINLGLVKFRTELIGRDTVLNERPK